MVDPHASQPTNRSGPFSNPPIDSPSTSAAFSGDNENENHSNPVVTHDARGLISSPSVHDQFLSPVNYNMSQHPNSFHSVQPLHVRTDLATDGPMTTTNEGSRFVRHSMSSGSLPPRTPSLRASGPGPNSATDSHSPVSAISSPQLLGINDITPLPSPIGGVSWRSSRADSLSLSRTSSSASRRSSSLGLRPSDSNQMLSLTRSRSRSKQYASLDKLGEESSETPSKPRRDGPPTHVRNRSLSEYIPPGRSVLLNQRPVVVSGSGSVGGIASSSSVDDKANNLHREQYLAVQRGIALTTAGPPTPPRSSRGSEGDSDNEPVISHSLSQGATDEIYSVRSVQTHQPRKYRKIRELGQGTFSQVSLAVRLEPDTENEMSNGFNLDGVPFTTRKLVAIKIIEHGPAGGADEARLEVSLKREVDILKSVNHPSLVQLKAFGSDDKRALLVLGFCPGGDLFDVAASKPKPMSPELIRRIFAELVAAVRYLHENQIVHRDIKLESEWVDISYQKWC